MVQKTDLNVSPYYDDFDETDNFHRTLFRPGFAIQARELTQLQSTLQNQIEKHGSHVFKEGSVVIPGAVHINTKYHSLKLATTFASETVNPAQYYSATSPVTITGATTGVSAVVIGFDAATSTDQPTLYLRYVNSGTDNVTNVFADGENISADAGITHTTAYSSGIASATTFTSEFSASAGSTAANLSGSSGPAARRGSAFHIEAGVYYVRGFFVTCAEETLVLDKYDNTPSYRIGFTVTESLVTPESDTTLLDNATGSSNYAAKGAHRLKIALALGKLARGSTADSTFIELMDVKAGVVQHYARNTEYAVLEETFARRTFDESGDYTVRPFQFIAKESVDVSVGNEDFTGAFAAGATTDDGNTASSSLLALQVSPGKAYIKGFEIEKMAPTIKDINKARDFNTVNAGVSTFDLGNFSNITNLYGTPDITFISGETTAFKKLELYDDRITTRGTANGSLIGVARARTIEYNTGTAGETTAVYKLFMFDIQPFTQLKLSGVPSPTLLSIHTNGGVQVKGVTSGATGFVFADGTTNSIVNLTNVVGTFSAGEKITTSDSAETDDIVEDSDNTDITIIEVVKFKFENARSVRMADADSGQDFTADFVLTTAAGEGGKIALETGTGELAGAGIQLETGTDGTNDVIILESRSIARLKDTQKNRAMFKLSKRVVKTLLTATNSGATDTQYTVRRQFTGTTNASGVVSFSAGSNETFLAFAEKDYTMSILTAGTTIGASTTTASQGDIVSATTGFSASGATLTITNAAVLGNGAKVKLTATLLKTSVSQKTKTTNLMKQLKVLHTDDDGAFGIRSTDRTISLGRADVYNLVGVFDSESTSTDAVAPTLTVTSIEGTFTRGEQITGSSSGAKGRIISTTSPFSFVPKTGIFSTSDTITGASSGATGTVSSTTLGDDVITSRYELDTGQRDNYYDISRIVRKPARAIPTGRLLVVYDYFEHGSGDVMTVDSYSDSADQMDYEDIPTYTATKVDPDAPKPSGEFPLTDTFDFRPRVEDIAGTSSTLEVVDQITANSFNFFARQYDGTGSSTVDVCKPGSFIQADFEFYLPKRVEVSMAKSGEIIVNEGIGAEEPNAPKTPDDVMKLCSIFLPAFTFRPKDVEIRREKNQRFTMRDIAELERRIDNVEYYTALNMLERDAESFEVTDSNGLNRFKAGFIVDNFGGHRVGDVQHKDYKCSIDMQKGQLRPVHKTKPISLAESVSTDAARTTAGYKKTGDLITLPYTEEVFTSQPFASRVEKVTPLLSHEWVGKITISPDADEWFETEIAPELIINVDGNFDAVTAAAQNQLGTVWNSWETQWSGSTRGEQRDGNNIRTILTTRQQQNRSGIRTEVVEQIDRESQGLRIINRAVIPIVRSRSIAFDGVDFRPNTRLYVFFDRQNVDAHVTPSSGFSSASTIIAGSPLVTSASGRVAGTFLIPDPTAEGSPQFQTGDIQFRLTSSSKNLTGTDASVDTNSTADATTDTLSTAGDTIYSSRGILETFQETIIATRNARVAQTSVNQTQTLTSSTVIAVRDESGPDGDGGGGGNDPLAQTFIVQGENSTDGRFVTSVDLFFSDKDAVAPVTVEIRNVINGYPGAKILPFGRVSVDSADVNVSDTAATATTFTFPSPVFLKPETEYAIAILTVSPEYKVWISRMGETDIGGSRTISGQPHTGVLFKSSNNSTWEPSQLEDLKFNLKTAKFTSGNSGTLTLVNDALPAKKLANNPISMTGNSTTLQIKHRDHHMYATSNNVTISGVSTGITTTLNGAITADATSLTLTSGTNFDDTSGKFSKTAANEFHIKIGDEIMKYTTISGTAVSSLSRGQQGTTAAAHADGATVELFMIHKVPLYEINKTHTAIANVGMDSYTITLDTTPVITGNATAEFGGSSVTATENSIMDTMKTIIGALELPNTSISSTIRPTTATSASGTQTSFSTVSATNAFNFPLNENFEFDAPHMACSGINETNELSGLKSCFIDLTMSTTSNTVSPVIDMQRTTLLSVANRLDNIDSSSDVFPTTEFTASTEPDGDNNSAIYLTKQVALENPATALKVLFNAHRPSTSEIKVMFKILRTDDSTDFDDLGYTFFNTTGVDDNNQSASADEDDFRDYIFTAGVTDDGIGDPLDEFIALQIKIVMQGTNSARPPRIKDFRTLALVT